MNNFVHLTVSSEYSVNYSICRISEIVGAAVEQKMPAVAITDHNNLYGSLKFFNSCIKSGIKPIIGASLDMKFDNKNFICYFYCQNIFGYKALNKMIFAVQNGPLDIKSLKSYDLSGLLMIVPPNVNFLENPECLKELITNFQDKAYIGIVRGELNHNHDLEQYMWSFAQKHNLPAVTILPVCFMNSEDFEAHEIRVCINKSELYKPDNSYYDKGQWFQPYESIADLFDDQPEALANTYEIARRCNFFFEQGINHLPVFPVSNGNLDDYFTLKVNSGLQERFAVHIDESVDKSVYINRLSEEIEIIKKMQFSGYFLIVADFIKWSRDSNIPVGPGRGSGAGSLVAYVLGITDIDPIAYGLLFERFLNPERVSMPDFDIDFCMEGRDKVIDYVSNKYGDDHVSQIITFGTLAAKAVVRDVGRVLGHPYGFVDTIAKLIPMDLGMTLSKALESEPELRLRVENDPEVARMFNLARKLEGLVRQVGRHAGGVVIAPKPLLDFMPVDYDVDQGSVSQFDKDDLESIGLVKFDFLGLRTLTIINWTLGFIANSGLDEVLLHKIPLDDEKVFKLLQLGNSTAVFQLESRGMKELIKRLKPDCFEDIVSLVALFRPGPLQSGMVDDFIDRKHGLSEITYLHPILEPILSATYGVILYQEQVMQIAQVLSGYTLGGADLLRRAMGKKKPEEMAKQRDVFIRGALKNNVSEDLSGQIFDLIEKFAGYGFNRSHSVAYAMLSYQTAWLKTHYPSQFMASVLTSDMDNTDKVINLLSDVKQLGLTIKLPNIEEGEFGFSVSEKGEIIYGLGGIKGVGSSAIETIINFRKSNGKVGDLFNLVSCLVKHGKMNKKLIEALCYSGALDVWGEPRENIIASIEMASKSAVRCQENQKKKQGDLFGAKSVDISYNVGEKWPFINRLEYEKSVLGYYLSGHPIDSMRAELEKIGLKVLTQAKVGRNRRLVGLISDVRIMQSKKGRAMLFFMLTDGINSFDVAVFGDLVSKAKEIIHEHKTVVIEGDASIGDGNIRFQAKGIYSLEDYKCQRVKVLYCYINDDLAPADFVEIIQKKLLDFPKGEVRVIFDYQGEQVLAGSKYYLKPEAYLLQVLLDIEWLNISFGYEIPDSCRSY